MVAHLFNPSIWEEEAGRYLWAQGQSDVQSELQSQSYIETLSMKLAKYLTNIFIRQTQMANRHMKRKININFWGNSSHNENHITAARKGDKS